MSAIACPQCRNVGKNVVLFSGLNADAPNSLRLPIVKCGVCAVVFTEPEAIPKEELYFEGYYGEARAESGLNKIAVSIFQSERRRLSLTGGSPKTVLDVGCGDGTYLAHLPSDIDRFGFEPSDAGRKSLEARGLTFFDVTSAASENSFDLITMWQSLEHVSAPDELLKKLGSLLSPDGTLFVSVPNFASWQARLFGSRWFHLDPTRHLYHYTPTTLANVLDRNGFKIVSSTTFSIEYGIFGWWQSLFNCLPLLDFNMGFKILKARKKYAMSPSFAVALAIYAVLAIPFAILAGFLTLLESAFGYGGVINACAKKR